MGEFRGFFTQIANKLENIPQVARRILDGKSVNDWGPTLTKQLEILRSQGSDFENLHNVKISENQARAFLHKINELNSPINKKLTVGQLMPFALSHGIRKRKEKMEAL